MSKCLHKTFKGINADEQLTTFINNHRVVFYIVQKYSGAINTKERSITISFDREDILRPHGD